MARRRLTPDERIYRLKQENKDLKAEMRLLHRDHKTDLAQLKSRYRATIKRLMTANAKLRRAN